MSVLGLCLRMNGSGLFAWISLTALSRTYFIIVMVTVSIILHSNSNHGIYVTTLVISIHGNKAEMVMLFIQTRPVMF